MYFIYNNYFSDIYYKGGIHKAFMRPFSTAATH